MVKSTLTLPLELNLGIRSGYPSNREYKSRQLAPHMLLMCPHPDQGILLCYGGHTYKGIPVQCIPLAITCCHFHTRRSGLPHGPATGHIAFCDRSVPQSAALGCVLITKQLDQVQHALIQNIPPAVPAEHHHAKHYDRVCCCSRPSIAAVQSCCCAGACVLCEHSLAMSQILG